MQGVRPPVVHRRAADSTAPLGGVDSAGWATSAIGAVCDDLDLDRRSSDEFWWAGLWFLPHLPEAKLNRLPVDTVRGPFITPSGLDLVLGFGARDERHCY
jgi:hypothetical protein